MNDLLVDCVRPRESDRRSEREFGAKGENGGCVTGAVGGGKRIEVALDDALDGEACRELGAVGELERGLGGGVGGIEATVGGTIPRIRHGEAGDVVGAAGDGREPVEAGGVAVDDAAVLLRAQTGAPERAEGRPVGVVVAVFVGTESIVASRAFALTER